MMSTIKLYVVIVITVLLTATVIYSTLNYSNQQTIEKLLIGQDRQIEQILTAQEEILDRDKSIIDTLINRLTNRPTYSINNDFNKLKTKKNSSVNIDLKNKVSPVVTPIPSENLLREFPEKNTEPVKQKWYKRIFRRQ